MGGRETVRDFLLFKRPRRLHIGSYSAVTGQFSPAVKLSGVEADRSSTSSAEANRALKITFAPLCNFVAYTSSV